MTAHSSCVTLAKDLNYDLETMCDPGFFCTNTIHKIVKALVISYNKSMVIQGLDEFRRMKRRMEIDERYLDEMLITCPTFPPSANYARLRLKKIRDDGTKGDTETLYSLPCLAVAAHNLTGLTRILKTIHTTDKGYTEARDAFYGAISSENYTAVDIFINSPLKHYLMDQNTGQLGTPVGFMLSSHFNMVEDMETLRNSSKFGSLKSLLAFNLPKNQFTTSMNTTLWSTNQTVFSKLLTLCEKKEDYTSMFGKRTIHNEMNKIDANGKRPIYYLLEKYRERFPFAMLAHLIKNGLDPTAVIHRNPNNDDYTLIHYIVTNYLYINYKRSLISEVHVRPCKEERKMLNDFTSLVNATYDFLHREQSGKAEFYYVDLKFGDETLVTNGKAIYKNSQGVREEEYDIMKGSAAGDASVPLRRSPRNYTAVSQPDVKLMPISRTVLDHISEHNMGVTIQSPINNRDIYTTESDCEPFPDPDVPNDITEIPCGPSPRNLEHLSKVSISEVNNMMDNLQTLGKRSATPVIHTQAKRVMNIHDQKSSTASTSTKSIPPQDPSLVFKTTMDTTPSTINAMDFDSFFDDFFNDTDITLPRREVQELDLGYDPDQLLGNVDTSDLLTLQPAEEKELDKYLSEHSANPNMGGEDNIVPELNLDKLDPTANVVEVLDQDTTAMEVDDFTNALSPCEIQTLDDILDIINKDSEESKTTKPDMI